LVRAPKQETTGRIGEAEVEADFVRLGWGVAENPHHDLGTDQFVMVRNIRRFDLGLVMGVQVKGGPSWFDEPVHDDDGNMTGWWFRESDTDHLGYWTGHVLPHLIVLHDVDTRVSYWAQITSEAVVSTGKGWKIFVPKAQVICEATRVELEKVAATARTGFALEGSLWLGGGPIDADDLWRFALVVPRLMPTRSGTGGSDLSPQVAVALLLQDRGLALHNLIGRDGNTPSFDEAATSADWGWRFMAAINVRVTSGDPGPLIAAAADAPDPAARAAATVAAVSALVDGDRLAEAIRLAESALEDDDLNPVDDAWVKMQLARLLAEIGRVDEARQLAADIQLMRHGHRNDPTATAIAGAAADLILRTSGWITNNADILAATDTAASWWRALTTASGLADLTDRSLMEWAEFRAGGQAGSDDPVNDQLLSPMLVAGYTGDHAAWRKDLSLLAENMLLQCDRYTPPAVVKAALDDLRLAGDKKALAAVAQRVLVDGPAVVLRQAAAAVDLSESTHTTAETDLVLLAAAGEVLEVATADRVVGWCLDIIADPRSYAGRTSPNFLVLPQVIDTLSAALPAASEQCRSDVVKVIVSMSSQTDALISQRWARLVTVMPSKSFNAQSAEAAEKAADTQTEDLRRSLLGVAARFRESARAALIAESAAGEVRALSELGDVRELDVGTVAAIVGRLESDLGRQADAAHQGSYGFGGVDSAHALALLNAWHEEHARWDPLLDFLADPAVAGHDKVGALGVLTNLVEQLPDKVRDRLAEMAVALVDMPVALEDFGFGRPDTRGRAAELAARVRASSEAVTAGQFSRLLSSPSALTRQAATRLAYQIGGPEGIGALSVLAHDPSPLVRAAAAGGLVRLLDDSDPSGLHEQALKRCAEDPGVQVGVTMASAFPSKAVTGRVQVEVLNQLAQNLSITARSKAIEALVRPPSDP
jgi:hypothetical protein